MTGGILLTLPHTAPQEGVAPVSSSEPLVGVQVTSGLHERIRAPTFGIDVKTRGVSTRAVLKSQEEVGHAKLDDAMAILISLSTQTGGEDTNLEAKGCSGESTSTKTEAASSTPTRIPA